MRVRGGILAVVCAGVAFAGPRMVRAQEATSAHLPDPISDRRNEFVFQIEKEES